MKSQNSYIGDDKFEKLLEHYHCQAPLALIKMRFIGAICSPNLNLRPTDVISSFWEEGQEPRLETKDEANLFFKFFMGLWDKCFEEVKKNKVKLPTHKYKSIDEAKAFCEARFAEVEGGFVEGFWGGCADLKLPSFIAEVIDSISDVAEVYVTIAKKADKSLDIEKISDNLSHSDKMIEKAISFIIENSVLPRIDSLKRTVNQ